MIEYKTRSSTRSRRVK